MIEAAELKDGEHVYDLGCGDGRILIAAQRAKKVHVVGFELAPLVYLLARVRLWAAKCRAQLHLKSFYKAQLQNADVIFCYLFPEVMEKLREKFFAECKPGTRIISHTFRMHGVEPYQVFPQDKKTGMPSIYVYKI
ncbi:class I SAM-dependent methyltransferase [Candidatus Gracilibacteria bacterium]|nr:class I SAM-dependent methyltransferase [Candidatus Gracilibacteria bacterium]